MVVEIETTPKTKTPAMIKIILELDFGLVVFSSSFSVDINIAYKSYFG